MSSSISIFGLGYVGSVSAACFARLGCQVVGVDINPAKVELLQSGRSPIVEPQIAELVKEACLNGRLHATTDAHEAIACSDISLLCVGTPSLRSGKLDLRHVEDSCREIGAALRTKTTHHIVVVRSTVLPGTTNSVIIPLLESSSGRQAGREFSVCYNPEFLREGTAVADFLQPPYTIVGGSDLEAVAAVRQLYANIPGETYKTSTTTAEMIKYASNAFHALKVGFANEIGTLCKNLAVETDTVTRIFVSDQKLNISAAYLSPGFAFGGSCLPKDLRALTHHARELDLDLPLLEAIIPSNGKHLERAVEMVLQTGKTRIAVLGLSFKAATDDLRESAQVELVKRLLGEGREVVIWDPHVSMGCLVGSNRKYIEEVIPHIGALLSTNLKQVIAKAEVIVLGTREGHDELARHLKPQQIVIDLVNLERSRRPDNGDCYQGICW